MCGFAWSTSLFCKQEYRNLSILSTATLATTFACQHQPLLSTVESKKARTLKTAQQNSAHVIGKLKVLGMSPTQCWRNAFNMPI